ncbi:uncharacterized protein LOC110019949 [Phalaenopsis equestris]|uniref:uncharacterized protein LOC110019949 n=1 Tax=Phalaenopsis equestris TaxID=78828 RepID=UPI0009E637CB|nr:uncharacterized protein LOC110019949 [Phalaenopsis equestris]XP_020573509.1 uncharacterized protein LOC110019949 [Phalaenopsis equestris]XP_020573510.1 uncharacterized protein LOC110019949 [Phalaenopsis equestris]
MSKSCTVKSDGACKGNPGKGGAGAVILNSSGDVVARVHKPRTFTTHNRAEYEDLSLGLDNAREMGYDDIHAIVDSQLVRNQVDRRWKVRSQDLYEPYGRVVELTRGLSRFEISHVPREYNTEADAEASRAFDE